MEDRAEVSKCLWIVVGVVCILSVGLWGLTGIGLRGSQFLVVVALTTALMSGSALYTFRRPHPRLARLLSGMAELLLLWVMIGALSYCGAALAQPLWDESFQRWDEALGFDWRFWLEVLNKHPNVHLVLVFAYHSMLPQTALAIIALATIRAYARLNIFLLAYGLAALATVAISTFMPALSPVVYLGISPADHPNIVLAVSPEFQEHAVALREGRMRIIDLSGAQGLVTFPSFHTVSAVLLLLAFWAVPYLRWISLGLNTLMLIAIPIEGSHYIVDVIAGAALALATWGLARWMVRREARASPLAASVIP
ncbi:MAG TPA: phosphatase PAP2 family protein [Afifellaceae bacterium]|nr:phosphatase PAP2 family protein [Afifellaceae bacterium]